MNDISEGAPLVETGALFIQPKKKRDVDVSHPDLVVPAQPDQCSKNAIRNEKSRLRRNKTGERHHDTPARRRARERATAARKIKAGVRRTEREIQKAQAVLERHGLLGDKKAEDIPSGVTIAVEDKYDPPPMLDELPPSQIEHPTKSTEDVSLHRDMETTGQLEEIAAQLHQLPRVPSPFIKRVEDVLAFQNEQPETPFELQARGVSTEMELGKYDAMMPSKVLTQAMMVTRKPPTANPGSRLNTVAPRLPGQPASFLRSIYGGQIQLFPQAPNSRSQ